MKKLKHVLLSILLLCLVSLGSFITIGFIRYELLISDQPLEETIMQIRNNPDYVALKDVDPDFLNALLAIEDPTFYEHQGVEPSNIMEAFLTNIKEQRLAMGGSTITQQLSKNMYLDQKKTFQRKIAELFFVHDLESSLTKDEILELYINVIYFGDGYYGIQQACQGYFQSSPKDITIAQATLLAGLPQAPAIYQLSDGMAYAKQRQQVVLDAMEEQKLINHKQNIAIYQLPV